MLRFCFCFRFLSIRFFFLHLVPVHGFITSVLDYCRTRDQFDFPIHFQDYQDSLFQDYQRELRLDFRRSPRGRSAGSFPEQRLVIEPKRT